MECCISSFTHGIFLIFAWSAVSVVRHKIYISNNLNMLAKKLGFVVRVAWLCLRKFPSTTSVENIFTHLWMMRNLWTYILGFSENPGPLKQIYPLENSKSPMRKNIYPLRTLNNCLEMLRSPCEFWLFSIFSKDFHLLYIPSPKQDFRKYFCDFPKSDLTLSSLCSFWSNLDFLLRFSHLPPLL